MRAQFYFRYAVWALLCTGGLVAHAHAQSDAPVNSALNGPLFYKLLVGEMELRAGQTAQAHELLLDSAQKTTDEHLFKRATHVALQMRDGPKALATVQAWRKALPASTQALRYEVQVLVALQRAAQAVPGITHLLAQTPSSERPSVISSLPELFSRHPEKKQVPQWLTTVLEPSLKDKNTRMAAQLTLGKTWLQADEPERAIELVSLAHQQNPKAQEPAVLALEIFSRTGLAQAVIDDFLSQKNQANPLRIAYARTLGSQQRYNEAVQQMLIVNQSQPELAAPWLVLGALYLELKKPFETTKVVNTYLERLHGGKITLTAKANNEDDELTSENTSSQGSTSQAYFLLSQAAAQQHDDAGARSWLEKVTDPALAMDVLSRQASLLADQGHLEQAISMVRASPHTTAQSPRDKLNIEAQLLTHAKRWADAERVLAKANELFPNDADLLYQQAMLAEKLDQVDAMEALLKRVMGLSPDHFHAYNALGYSLAERNLRLTEAKELISQALAIAPGEPFITDSLGWVEYRLGHFDEAIRLLQLAYRLRPDVEIAVHLGEVLWAHHQPEAARKILRQAQTKEATNPVLVEVLARLKIAL